MKTKLLLSTAIVAVAFTSHAFATIVSENGNLTVTKEAMVLPIGEYNNITVNTGSVYFYGFMPEYRDISDKAIKAESFSVEGNFMDCDRDAVDEDGHVIKGDSFYSKDEDGNYTLIGNVNDEHHHQITINNPEPTDSDYNNKTKFTTEYTDRNGKQYVERPFSMGKTTLEVAGTFEAKNTEFDVSTGTLIADKIDTLNTDITVMGFDQDGLGNDFILAGKDYNTNKDYTNTYFLTNELTMNVTDSVPMGIGDDRINFVVKDGVTLNLKGQAGMSASALIDKLDDWRDFIVKNFDEDTVKKYISNYSVFANIQDSEEDDSNYENWKNNIRANYDEEKANEYIAQYDAFRNKVIEKNADFEDVGLQQETVNNYGKLTIEGGTINLSENSLMLASNDITISGGEVNFNDKSQIVSLVLFDGPKSEYTFKDGPFKDWGVLKVTYGNFKMTGGLVNINGDNKITGKDYVTIAGGTLNINEGAKLSNVSLNGNSFGNAGFMVTDSGVMDIKGILHSEANIEGSSPVAVANGGILRLNSNNAKIESAVGILNKGTLDIGLNKPTITGPAIFANGATLGIKVNSQDEHGILNADVIFKDGASITVSTDKSMKIGDKMNNLTLINGNVAAENKDLSNGRFNVRLNNNGKFDIEYTQSARDRVAEAGDSSLGGMADAWDGLDIIDNNAMANIKKLLDELSQYNAVGYAEALKTLAPSATPMIQQTQAETANQVFSAVGSRLSGGSNNNAQGMSSGDALNGVALWIQGMFNHAKFDGNKHSKGFDSDTWGTALGVEKQLNRAVKAGVGYAYSKTDIDGFMRDTDVKTHTAILYGEYKPSNWYANAVVSYGWSDYDEKKNVAGSTINAKYDAETFGLQTMTGYDFYTKYALITPEMGLRYIHIKTDSYIDGAGQRVKSDDSDIVTGVIGSKLSKSYALSNGMWIKPEAKMALTYDLVHDDVKSTVTLPNGSSYSVSGKPLNRFGVEVGGGVNAELNDNVEVFLGYEGKFRKDYQDHSGLVNAKYKF